MLFFRILLPLLLIGIQFMLYRRLRHWLRDNRPAWQWAPPVAASLFLLFNTALVAVFAFRPNLLEMPSWFLYVGAYPFFVWHGATFFIGFILLLASLVSAPVRLGIRAAQAIRRRRKPAAEPVALTETADTSRRVFLRRSVYGLTALSFAGSSYGVVFGRTRGEITRCDVHIPGLDPSFEGFTIGLLSDIHSSAFMQRPEMERYAEAMNGLGADAIVVTGDFVNSTLDEVYPLAEAFSALRAPHGVYGVLGNHDFFTRHVDLVAREIDDCGVTLLRNDHALIRKDGGSLAILGVDDVGRPDQATSAIAAAGRGVTERTPRILLCHRPYFLKEAAEGGVDLVLSGHTHGGQVSFGNLGGTHVALASLASRYVWGLYEEHGARMYVNRGIGTVGLPIRINCPPELTVIRLTGAASSSVRLERTFLVS